MSPHLPRRIITLLAYACALVALTAGMALAHAGRDRAPAPPAPPQVSAFGGGIDVITVRATKCPKSHPRRVGSYSASSTTQINGRVIRRRSVHRVVCAR
jgi:hypothetical protein